MKMKIVACMFCILFCTSVFAIDSARTQQVQQLQQQLADDLTATVSAKVIDYNDIGLLYSNYVSAIYNMMPETMTSDYFLFFDTYPFLLFDAPVHFTMYSATLLCINAHSLHKQITNAIVSYQRTRATDNFWYNALNATREAMTDAAKLSALFTAKSEVMRAEARAAHTELGRTHCDQLGTMEQFRGADVYTGLVR